MKVGWTCRCDTLEGIRHYNDDKPLAEEQVRLHDTCEYLQGMKRMGDDEA